MFASVLLRIGLSYLSIIGIVCFLAAAEMAFPRSPLLPFRHRVRLLIFAAIYGWSAFIAGLAIGIGANWLGLHPLFHLGLLASAVMGVVVGDFIYYWYHRAQHMIPALWRVHATHHSAENLGAGAGFHHVFEAPLRGLLVGIPAFLIAGNGAAMVGFVMTVHGFYVHSSTRLNFGRFAWLLCDNRVHRIHHSREPHHFDKNFGVVTLLWDRLFGTAYFPSTEEWPATGLSDMPEPCSVREWLRLHQPRLDDPHVYRLRVEHTGTVVVSSNVNAGGRVENRAI